MVLVGMAVFAAVGIILSLAGLPTAVVVGYSVIVGFISLVALLSEPTGDCDCPGCYLTKHIWS